MTDFYIDVEPQTRHASAKSIKLKKPMWYISKNQQVTVHILAKPHAKHTALLGATETELLIAIHAKPHDGEANIELVRYVSKLLHIPKSYLTLQGQHSRHKKITAPLTNKLSEILKELEKKLVDSQPHGQ